MDKKKMIYMAVGAVVIIGGAYYYYMYYYKKPTAAVAPKPATATTSSVAAANAALVTPTSPASTASPTSAAPTPAPTAAATPPPPAASGVTMKTSTYGVQVAVPNITPEQANAKYPTTPAGLAGVVISVIQNKWQNSANPSKGTGPATGVVATLNTPTWDMGPCSQQGLMGPPSCGGCGVRVDRCQIMADLYAKMYAGGDLQGVYTY